MADFVASLRANDTPLVSLIILSRSYGTPLGPRIYGGTVEAKVTSNFELREVRSSYKPVDGTPMHAKVCGYFVNCH